jgi:hypothetical protein
MLLMLVAPFPINLVLYASTTIFQLTAIFTPILLGGYYLLAIPAIIAIATPSIRRQYASRIKLIDDTHHNLFSWKHFIIIIKTFGFSLIKSTGLNPLPPYRIMSAYPFLESWLKPHANNPRTYRLDSQFWLGILAITTITCLYVILPSHRNLILLIAISTLQWSAVLPIHQLAADRYSSIPSLFISFLIATYIPDAYIILIPLYTYQTIKLQPMYAHILGFYNYHKSLSPNMKRLELIKSLYNI